MTSRTAIALLCLVLLAGCRVGDGHQRHACGDGAIPEADWEFLPSDAIHWVANARINQASEELGVQSFRRLGRSTAMEHVGDPELPESGAPFLVRACSYGAEPTFAAVRVAEEGKLVHIHQATAEPEMFLPSQNTEIHPRPLVLLLERAPEKVFVTAFRGGDRAWRGFGGVMKHFPH